METRTKVVEEMCWKRWKLIIAHDSCISKTKYTLILVIATVFFFYIKAKKYETQSTIMASVFFEYEGQSSIVFPSEHFFVLIIIQNTYIFSAITQLNSITES